MFDLFKKILGNLKEKSNEGERLFREGIASASVKQHDKAIELFTRSIKIMDIYPAPFINRGASYAYQERYLDAWSDYARALHMEKTDPSPHARENLAALQINMSAIAPFMAIERENGDLIREMLLTDGMDHFTKRWAQEIAKKLNNNPRLIRHLILEELNELYDLGGKHKNVALNSGFNSSDYLGVRELPETVNAFVFMKSILCCFSPPYSRALTKNKEGERFIL